MSRIAIVGHRALGPASVEAFVAQTSRTLLEEARDRWQRVDAVRLDEARLAGARLLGSKVHGVTLAGADVDGVEGDVDVSPEGDGSVVVSAADWARAAAQA